MMADRLPAETPERESREARRKEKIMKQHLVINGKDMGEAFRPRPNYQSGRIVWLMADGYYISVDRSTILEKIDDFTVTIYQGKDD